MVTSKSNAVQQRYAERKVTMVIGDGALQSCDASLGVGKRTVLTVKPVLILSKRFSTGTTISGASKW
jgi:hypothetical protein